MITVAGFAIAGVVGGVLWWVYTRLLLMSQRKGQGSAKKMWLPARLRAVQSQKEYELLQRHEV